MKNVFLCLFCFSILRRAINSRHLNQNLPKLNVLLMIADDLGIGDLSCYGNKNIKTPNLDILAAEGIRFNRMYSFPSDSGSMSAILTGVYTECKKNLNFPDRSIDRDMSHHSRLSHISAYFYARSLKGVKVSLLGLLCCK
jgi:hypothetical protein